MPGVFAALYRHFTAGRLEEARANRVIDVLLAFGLLPGLKEGFDAGHCTAPLKRFSGGERDAFFERLRALGYPEEYVTALPS